jgi:NADH dehydrogenase FAD-containing subunit
LLGKHCNVEFELAEVTGIDAAAKKVTARRPLGEPVEFGYDYPSSPSASGSLTSGMTTTPRSRPG